MLSLLAYAKYVSIRTPGGLAGSMWWSTDRQTFFIKGAPIQLARFQAMAQGIVADAERVLWEELLWVQQQPEVSSVGSGRSAPVQLAAIQDDVTLA